LPQLEGWQIAPYYQPAREVGGDFYDFHPLSEGRLGVVVGDATGKGVPAALVMSTTCGMLQLAAQALESSSPGEILERVNETLLASPLICSSPASTQS
jgi:serine phosphatase RsbU (regulator of sigma subunit)